MNFDVLTVVGVGMMGGSIALAAKHGGLVKRVIGLDQAEGPLREALSLGMIDESCADWPQALRQSSTVVFCMPVDQIAQAVIDAAPHCQADALLMDIGSTKTAIVRGVEAHLAAKVNFVGGHPLAGSDKSGPAHARADLFDGRLVILTPSAWTNVAALDCAVGFWQALGARVRIMEPEDHDCSLAITSHLPQLVASALAGVLPPELFALAASGFLDTTRLARSNSAMWKAIFTQNRSAVLAALSRFEAQLGRFRQAIDAADPAALEDLMAAGRRVREALDK